MGHFLFFYSKDTGRLAHFTPPDYALKDITRILRYRQFKKKDQGYMPWGILTIYPHNVQQCLNGSYQQEFPHRTTPSHCSLNTYLFPSPL